MSKPKSDLTRTAAPTKTESSVAEQALATKSDTLDALETMRSECRARLDELRGQLADAAGSSEGERVRLAGDVAAAEAKLAELSSAVDTQRTELEARIASGRVRSNSGSSELRPVKVSPIGGKASPPAPAPTTGTWGRKGLFGSRRGKHVPAEEPPTGDAPK